VVFCSKRAVFSTILLRIFKAHTKTLCFSYYDFKIINHNSTNAAEKVYDSVYLNFENSLMFREWPKVLIAYQSFE